MRLFPTCLNQAILNSITQTKPPRLATLCAATLMALLMACTTTHTEPTPTGQAQKGYVVGTATDAQGKPLTNVEVTAYNTLTNSTIGGRTDAQGNYRIRLENLATWYVKAVATIAYEGTPYALRMHVLDATTFTHGEGAVQNMVLKASGERTGMYGDEGYYGAKVTVMPDMSGDFYGSGDALISFEPVGLLLDGSKGRSLTRQADPLYIYNVPLGKYTITATHKTTGKALLLRRGFGGSAPYVRSLTTTFTPTHKGSDRYELELQLKPE